MHSTSKAWRLPFSALVLLLGCSSETSTPADGGVEASTRDANANCVKPGTANNELGLGAYCEKKADCPATGALCTANFNAPDDAWFCSKLCSAQDTKCGTGMYCNFGDPRGNACVPLVCGPPGAGVDAAADSAPDTSTPDAGPDAADAAVE
ncbi:MAG: hypothetical protein JWM74_103 [Myxococcaceae bacterium]|nr:hypothetical protein [Myxococcaceae bacterium]